MPASAVESVERRIPACPTTSRSTWRSQTRAATLKEIEARGGKTVMGPEEIMPGTTIAVFLDSHGNMVALSKAE